MHVPDENFFLADPQTLIYTHFPEEENWQLLDDKKSLEEFESTVFLKDRFFDLDMRVLSHQNCNIDAEDGEVEILLGLHQEHYKNHAFLCFPTKYDKSGSSRTKRIVLPEKSSQLDFISRSNENVLSVKVRFPEVGKYKLEIVGKDLAIKRPDYEYDWVAIYNVTVDSVPQGMKFFPKAEPAGWGPGKVLNELGLEAVSNGSGIIDMQPGQLNVKLKITDEKKFKEAKTKIGFQVLPVEGGEAGAVEHLTSRRFGDTLEASFAVPKGEYVMKILHAQEEGQALNVCNYHVFSGIPKEERNKKEPADEETVYRDKLNKVIAGQKLEELERTVDLVESKGYANKLGPEVREARDLIVRLRRLQKLIHEVMTLNQVTIAEIRSYTNPVPEVHTCMKVTLLLLGHPEKETEDWKNVQGIIGKTGKMSLKRRIGECDVSKLKPKVVKRARTLLASINLEDIVILSAGAATFYTWASGITM